MQKLIIKEFVSYFFNRSFAGAVWLLSVIIFTRILTPKEYASYSITISAMNVIYALFFLWLSLSFARFYEPNKHYKRKFFSTISFSFILIAMTLLAIKVLSNQLAYINFNFSWPLYFLVISYAWYEMHLRLLNIKQDIIGYGNLVRNRACTGLFFAVVLYNLYGVVGIFSAFIFSSIILPILTTKPHFFSFNIIQIDRAVLRELFFYGLPLSITTGLTLIVDFSDRFLIAKLMSPEDAGLYSANYDFVLQTLGFLTGIFYLTFFPHINKIYESKNYYKFNKQFTNYLNIVLLAVLPISIFYICLANDFSNIFLGSSFRSSSEKLIPVISIGILLGNFKAYIFDLVFYLKKITFIQIIPALFIATFNVFLNFLWIPQFGLIGAAYATMFSFTLGALLSYLISRHYQVFPRHNSDTLKIIFSASIMLIYLIIAKPNNTYNLIIFFLLILTSLILYLLLIFFLDVFRIKQNMKSLPKPSKLIKFFYK
jgi:O-antigen/teichoic acid export membrane protein